MAVDPQPLAVGLERVGQVAAGLLVVDRLESEDDVGRGERLAVGEDHAFAQLQRVAPPIVGSRPAFGQPRLDLLGDLIDAHQLRLRKVREQLRRGLAGREAAERARLGADGGDEVPAARDRRAAGGFRRLGRPARDGPQAATAAVTAAASASANDRWRVCLVKCCPAGQKTGRLRLRAIFGIVLQICVQIRGDGSAADPSWLGSWLSFPHDSPSSSTRPGQCLATY